MSTDGAPSTPQVERRAHPRAPSRRPRPSAVIRAVSRVTFFEIIRDKVLYNVILCAILLIGVGFLAARLSFLRQDRVILNFGLAAVALSCSMVALFMGGTLVGREYDRRTIFVALAKPISRFEFIWGKFAGLALVVALNWVLLSLVYLLILWQVSGEGFSDLVNGTLAWGLVLALMQSLTMAGLVVFFSSVSTTSLAVIVTLGLYLIGTNVSQLRLLATRSSGAAAFLMNAAATVLPNFEHFNLGTKVTYGFPVPFSTGVLTVLYAFLLIQICLLGAGLVLHRRET